MFKVLLQRWSDWTGDRELTRAIHAELRRTGHAVTKSEIREVRLAAIQRPGWIQVYRFSVETSTLDGDSQRRPVVLLGLSRDDGRRAGIEILLTEDESTWRQRLAEWSEGLVSRC